MFLGGWYSFTGEMGKGGWGRTRLAELLPVRCLDYEDLVESTEGFTARLTDDGRAAFAGVDIESMPPILGYNKTLRRPEGTVLVEVRETGDPLVAVSLSTHPTRRRTGAVTSCSGKAMPPFGWLAWTCCFPGLGERVPT
jgi:uncharacterized membrane protein